jgi:hypothetical protein
MDKSNKKPFIPRDKPKSWVLFVLFLLAALLVAAPITILGIYFDLGIVKGLGTTLFVICILISFPLYFVFLGGMLRGKYSNIKEQNWENQVW